MQTLPNLVRAEIHDYLHQCVEVVPGYNFDTYETIKRIHLYDASQFEDGSEYGGLEPIFFNICNYRRDNIARFLDFNTSDINIEEMNPNSEAAAKMLEQQLRRYLRDQNYTAKINEMANYLATYGSVVLHKREDGIDEMVDLRRLFFDPTVNSLQDSRFVSIKMMFTEDELRRVAKEAGWDTDAVESIIVKKRKSQEDKKSTAGKSYEDEGSENLIHSANYIEVYKRWGVAKKGQLFGTEDRDEVRSFTVIAEPSLCSGNGKDKTSVGEVLFADEYTEDLYPFEECHLIKVQGRWLGVGTFELLFPMQQRFNELKNQGRVAMEISSLHLFQTSDTLTFNNILNDLQSGDVIKTNVQGSLQPIVNEERNLSAMQMEEQSYQNNADALSFRNDVISGNIPSSMPATNALIAQNNVTAVHLVKRQNFVNMMRRFIRENVLEELYESIDEKTVLRFIGEVEDFEVLDKNIKKMKLVNKVIDRGLAGSPVLEFEREDLEQEVAEEMAELGNKRFYKMVKNYYKDKELDLDINIDSEQRDVDKVVQNTFSFVQAFVNNPESLQNPVVREFAYQVGRDIGIDTTRLDAAISKSTQQTPTQVDTQPASQLEALTASNGTASETPTI